MSTNDSVITDYTSTDDAAVVRLGDGKIILQTVDFFTPIVDDPYTFGQISAANSLSDIYAMGGKPLFALNIVGFPIKELSNTILSEIMQGGADKAAEAGIPIVGGHSIDDSEPKYGLVVTGEAIEQNIWTNSGAQPGDHMILTKPIGTGIISTAIKKEKASIDIISSASDSMKTLNKKASEIAQKFNPTAVTDITGFGLIGHLIEVCDASNVSATINFNEIEFLPGAVDLANEGVIPGGSKRNFEHAEKFTAFSSGLSSTQKLLTCDAQTSGGLLITLPPKEAAQFLNEFGVKAKKIGEIEYRKTKPVSVIM